MGQGLRSILRVPSSDFSGSSPGTWGLPGPAGLPGWGTWSHFFPSVPSLDLSLPFAYFLQWYCSRRSHQPDTAMLIWGDSRSLDRMDSEVWATFCSLKALGPEAGVWAWASAPTHPCSDLQPVGPAYPRWGSLRPLLCNESQPNCEVRGNSPHQTALTSDTKCKFEELT